MFTTYNEAANDEQLFVGNSSTSIVAGQGKVILKMTSGKELPLNNVLHVPDIRKNLVSSSLLSKNGFRLVFESDKFVLSKSDMYVGKGYMSDGFFKLNVMTVEQKVAMNKKNTSFVYIHESNLWHGRIGLVNFAALRRLIGLDYILKFEINPNLKCEVCVEAKLTKAPFKSVERKTKPLELIHTNICDLKFKRQKVFHNIYR